MVRAGSSDKILRVRLGEEIEGWKVTQIEPRRLVLSHDDRSVNFEMFAQLGAKSKVIQDATPAPADNIQNVAKRRLDRRSGRY